jgi:hypothetical protein
MHHFFPGQNNAEGNREQEKARHVVTVRNGRAGFNGRIDWLAAR